MTQIAPFYLSDKGGSISCFIGDSGRTFRSGYKTRCIYSANLHAAKTNLDNLESINKLLIGKGGKWG